MLVAVARFGVTPEVSASPLKCDRSRLPFREGSYLAPFLMVNLYAHACCRRRLKAESLQLKMSGSCLAQEMTYPIRLRSAINEYAIDENAELTCRRALNVSMCILLDRRLAESPSRSLSKWLR